MRDKFKKQIVASFLQDSYYLSYGQAAIEVVVPMLTECKFRNIFQGEKVLKGFTYVEFYLLIQNGSEEELTILTFEYPNNDLPFEKVKKAISSLVCFPHEEGKYFDDETYKEKWIYRNIFVAYDTEYDKFVVRSNGIHPKDESIDKLCHIFIRM